MMARTNKQEIAHLDVDKKVSITLAVSMMLMMSALEDWRSTFRKRVQS